MTSKSEETSPYEYTMGRSSITFYIYILCVAFTLHLLFQDFTMGNIDDSNLARDLALGS